MLDKWLAVQAGSRLPGTLAEVKRLMQHPVFDLKNPNKVRALVSTFCLPPTFAFIIDAPSDLPGPGAISFPGQLQLGSPGGAFTDAVSPPAARW